VHRRGAPGRSPGVAQTLTRLPAPAQAAHLARRPVRDTPARLVTGLLVAVVVTVGFGVLGFLDLRARDDAVTAARAEAANLVTVQSARTKLVTADALAANLFLLGDAATEVRSRQYDYALRRASLDLALASRAARADRNDLAIAGRWLARYAGEVSAARLPGRSDGAAALTAASGLLRAEVLPRLARVQERSAARLAGEERRVRSADLLLLLAGTLALAVLAGGQVWLAGVSHRVLNPALVLATVVVLGAGILGVVTVQRSQSRAADVAAGPSAASDALVAARIRAFDARAAESLALVRGRGDVGDGTWREDVTEVRSRFAAYAALPGRADLAAAVEAELRGYERAHAATASLEARGRHEDAVAQSVRDAPRGRGEVGGATGEFDDLDLVTAAALTREQDGVDAGLEAARHRLVLAGWVLLLAGVAAAGLAWAGISRRLADFR
jgi:hypothetical protein